jgi:hypothetical protein
MSASNISIGHRESTMCSAIFCRIIDIGSRSSSPVNGPEGPSVAPVANGTVRLEGAGTATGRDGAAFGVNAGRAVLPASTKARMSSLVTRPWRPEPVTALKYTPCSAAIRRTSGEERWRSSSDSASKVAVAFTDAATAVA